MPKISVIIPCYNHGKYIDETVESVLSQTFQNFEIIIVDDGSTDEFTMQKLKNYNKPKTKVVFTENKGVSSARNTAVSIAEGKYILPLDADDIIDENFLILTNEVLDNNKNIKIAYSEVEFFEAKTGKWKLETFDIKKMLLYNQIVCTALFRKKNFEQTIGYNVNMKEGMEDWDFWLTLLENGGEAYRIPKVLFHYRIKEKSRNNTISEANTNKLAFQIFSNHIELYKKHLKNPISIYNENISLLNELELIKNSFLYKIGKLLTKPFPILKRFLKN